MESSRLMFLQVPGKCRDLDLHVPGLAGTQTFKSWHVQGLIRTDGTREEGSHSLMLVGNLDITDAVEIWFKNQNGER